MSKKEFLRAALNGDLKAVRSYLEAHKGHIDINTKVRSSSNFGIQSKDRFSLKGLKGFLYNTFYYKDFNYYHDQSSVTKDTLPYHYVWFPANRRNFLYRYRHGMTALSLASEAGHLSIVSSLLRVPGVDVNAPDSNGCTPLMLAAQFGHIRVVKKLMAFPGVHINSQDISGYTALMWAAVSGHNDVVQYLLNSAHIDVNCRSSEGDRYALVNARNVNGFSALVLAIAKGKKEVVQELINDPDIDLAARFCYANRILSAEEIANRFGQKEIADLIKEKKAALTFQERINQINSELEVPEQLTCPINPFSLMSDPITVSSGITYDRQELKAYFAALDFPEYISCPITQKSIFRYELRNGTNILIKDQIEEYVLEQEGLYKQIEEQEKNGKVLNLGTSTSRAQSNNPHSFYQQESSDYAPFLDSVDAEEESSCTESYLVV